MRTNGKLQTDIVDGPEERRRQASIQRDMLQPNS
jgi:hypothetical protein